MLTTDGVADPRGIEILVPAGVHVEHRGQRAENAEYIHLSTVNNVLQCIRGETPHTHRVFPKRALDFLSFLEDIADFFLPEESPFVVYKLFKCQ